VRVSSYDLEGRPYALVRDGWTYRRSLDGSCLQKREGTPRIRRRLDPEKAAPVAEEARREAEAALAALGDGPQAKSAGEEGRRRLRRIVEMDGPALAADAARFRDIYRPVGVLPPDQYLAVVLQGTEGCAWNSCTFCDLFRDVRYRTRTEEEFEAHVRAVIEYFGESLALRRSVFLGSASVLAASDARVKSYLDTIDRAFAVAPRALAAWGEEQWVHNAPRAIRGVSAFVDVWTGGRRTGAQWADYARRGLRRVYVGLESGDPGLLSWLEKPFTPDQAVELVRALHEAGVAAGVIVLLGAGGERYDDAHSRRTAEALARMELRASDLVYFSEFVCSPGLEYEERARAADDLRPLPTHACAAQRRRILAGLPASPLGEGPRVASYDIREFVY
jgi:radical SAM superfamily enzyme YgiQ (UPF0313 family)